MNTLFLEPDFLARQFDGHSNEAIMGAVKNVITAAETALGQRGTSLTEVQQAINEREKIQREEIAASLAEVNDADPDADTKAKAEADAAEAKAKEEADAAKTEVESFVKADADAKAENIANAANAEAKKGKKSGITTTSDLPQ